MNSRVLNYKRMRTCPFLSNTSKTRFQKLLKTKHLFTLQTGVLTVGVIKKYETINLPSNWRNLKDEERNGGYDLVLMAFSLVIWRHFLGGLPVAMDDRDWLDGGQGTACYQHDQIMMILI